jgi:hypothetical protein
MVQPTDFGSWNDRTEVRRLDRPPIWCLLVEGQVSAGAMVVRKIGGQDASQVAVTENEDMVQALASHRADEALCKGILPRALRSCEDLLYTHALHAFRADGRRASSARPSSPAR